MDLTYLSERKLEDYFPIQLAQQTFYAPPADTYSACIDEIVKECIQLQLNLLSTQFPTVRLNDRGEFVSEKTFRGKSMYPVITSANSIDDILEIMRNNGYPIRKEYWSEHKGDIKGLRPQ